MLVDTKIKKPTHTLIMALLTPFLFTIPLVVEIKSFLYSKVQSSLTVSDKKNAVDIGTKRTIRDTDVFVQLYGRC